jgi:hypothetical protein
MHESARPSRRRSRAKLIVRGERPCPLSLSRAPGEQAAHAPKDAGLETVRAQITGNSIQFFQRAALTPIKVEAALPHHTWRMLRRPAIGVHFEGHRRYRSRFDDLGGNRIAFERETPVMSVMTVDRTT